MESPQTALSRRSRHAITSITALLAGSSLTTIQTFITYYLYASRVPKRVFTILNALGISSSYRTLTRIVEQANEVKRILKGIAARGQAIQISFDNINWQNDVRYMTLHNWISFGSGVVGYVLIPAKFTPMFPRSAVNHDAAKDLTLRDSSRRKKTRSSCSNPSDPISLTLSKISLDPSNSQQLRSIFPGQRYRHWTSS